MDKIHAEFDETTLQYVFQRDSNTCFHCQLTTPITNVNITRIIPKTYGGPSTASNAVVSHPVCNNQFHIKYGTTKTMYNVKLINIMLDHVKALGDVPEWSIHISATLENYQSISLDKYVYDREHTLCLFCMHPTKYENGSAKLIASKNITGAWTTSNLVWACYDCQRNVSTVKRMYNGLDYLYFIGAIS